MSEQAKPAQDTPQAETKAPSEQQTPAKEATPNETKEATSSPDKKEEPKPENKETKETKTDPENKRVVPEKYELKLPENSLLKGKALERIAAIAKAQGLTQEEAQALVESESQSVASYVEEQSAAWMKEVESDTELGGEKFKENVEIAKRVVERFGSEPLKQELNKTGYGNHPELIRLLYRIGKGMSEDGLVHPGAAAGKKTMEEVFYGSGQ